MIEDNKIVILYYMSSSPCPFDLNWIQFNVESYKLFRNRGWIHFPIKRQGSVTHWEEDNGDGESDGREHRHSDAQDERVIGVNPAVGVQ